MSKSASPTKLTRDNLTEKGLTFQVVEYWNSFARRRIDLFGIIDIVVLLPDSAKAILGIQCTSSTNHSARMKKAREEPRLKEWMRCGGLFEVWSWKTTKVKGKRATHTLRVESLRYEEITA